jgi:hypothetical protein
MAGSVSRCVAEKRALAAPLTCFSYETADGQGGESGESEHFVCRLCVTTTIAGLLDLECCGLVVVVVLRSWMRPLRWPLLV